MTHNRTHHNFAGDEMIHNELHKVSCSPVSGPCCRRRQRAHHGLPVRILLNESTTRFSRSFGQMMMKIMMMMWMMMRSPFLLLPFQRRSTSCGFDDKTTMMLKKRRKKFLVRF